MHPIRASLALFFLTSGAGNGSDIAQLRNVERRIAKEPKYVAGRPLYGLLVFGPAAQNGVWMVLDHSDPKTAAYDVLYVDLNANGDLTEPNERLEGARERGDIRFSLPDLKDPVTGAVHTHLTARVSAPPAPNVMVSVRWRGRFKMGGGYPEDPDNGYMKFGDKPANAPVMWASGDNPFRFQRWYSGKLPIGGEEDFKVFVGQPGAGASAFWAFQEHFLPESEGVQATFIYHDQEDKERRVVCLLKERC
jgi:hypothetical protein